MNTATKVIISLAVVTALGAGAYFLYKKYAPKTDTKTNAKVVTPTTPTAPTQPKTTTIQDITTDIGTIGGVIDSTGKALDGAYNVLTGMF